MDFVIQHKWAILALVELIVIISLLWFVRKKRKTNPEQIEIIKSKDASIDMNEMMKNIHLSAELHKKLTRICHPDRFAGTQHTDLANELFQEIQQYSTNHAQLLVLQERIEKELKVSI
jgi:hypothetical protein